mmetsp:Transcript_89573/g.164397  ORF Transcript_89573/g.164397 Transcript_89573/m.164397 type:complete len:85 (-) Transcript_89573:12-266(-)
MSSKENLPENELLGDCAMYFDEPLLKLPELFERVLRRDCLLSALTASMPVPDTARLRSVIAHDRCTAEQRYTAAGLGHSQRHNT